MRCVLFLLSFLLCGTLSAQTNPDYDPDFDGNGCYTVLDILSFLVILMPDDAGMDSPNPDYDPDFDNNGEFTVMDLTGMLTWFGGCAPELLCESPTMDGYTYSVVAIGDQCWFAENLRTTVYGNGDLIPAGLTDDQWTSTTAGASVVYGEGSSLCESYSPDIDACDEAQSLSEYGRLYNWFAVDDARGLCPVGWHVPTDGEWTELEDYITSQGFSGMEGTALKSTAGWYDNGNGTDDFGFSALPGGVRYFDVGTFVNAGDNGYWWSSSSDGGNAWTRYMFYANPVIVRFYYNPRNGFSVRCLRDAE